MIHVQPTTELASRVLLPGDPGRALRLATALLEQPKMFNHNRGLWGYTGVAHDGEPLTIQSTGMGGPSAAIVVHELIELGARTLLRVGTCGALTDALALGQLVIVTEAIAADGTSRTLGAAERVPAPEPLLSALRSAAGVLPRPAGGPMVSTAPRTTAGAIVTSDLFYDDREPAIAWAADGALAVEMETSVLLTLAAKRRVPAGALLIVADRVFPTRARIDQEKLELAELEMGRIALSALGISGHTSTST